MKGKKDSPRSIIQELVEQVEDFIINYQCPCVKTRHCPCPRCQVTIEQGRELITRLKISDQLSIMRCAIDRAMDSCDEWDIGVRECDQIEVTTHEDGPDNRKFIPYIRESE